MGYLYELNYRLGSRHASNEALNDSKQALADDLEKIIGKAPFLRPTYRTIDKKGPIRNKVTLEIIFPVRLEEGINGIHPGFYEKTDLLGNPKNYIKKAYLGEDIKETLRALKADPCYIQSQWLIPEKVWYDAGLTWGNWIYSGIKP